mgnify:CR=1 FL=1
MEDNCGNYGKSTGDPSGLQSFDIINENQSLMWFWISIYTKKIATENNVINIGYGKALIMLIQYWL